MVSKKAMLEMLESIAPKNLAMDWDNCGLLIDANEGFKRLLLCVDISNAVLQEAIDGDYDLIISHHPLIFNALKNINHDSLVFKAIKNNISVYAAHTNMDIVTGGLNDELAKLLGLTKVKPLMSMPDHPMHTIIVFAPRQDAESIMQALSKTGAATMGNYKDVFFKAEGQGTFTPKAVANPAVGVINENTVIDEVRIECICNPLLIETAISAVKASHSYEAPAIDVCDLVYPSAENALGKVGQLLPAMTVKEFALHVKKTLNIDGIRVCGQADKRIKTVAVACGSGGDMVAAAKRAGADVLLTGEAKHNEYMDAVNAGLALIEAGHYHTEKHFVNLMANRLQAVLITLEYNLQVKISEWETPPYFTIE